MYRKSIILRDTVLRDTVYADTVNKILTTKF